METLVKSSRQSLIWRSLMMMLSRKTNRKKVMKMTTRLRTMKMHRKGNC